MAQGGNERFAGYQVYDRHYEKIGKVEHLFVDEGDRLEYVGVKTGFFGNRSTPIPMGIVRVNDERQLMEVDSEKDTITNSPTFGDDGDLAPELEERVYAHFGLKRERSDANRGDYHTGRDYGARTGERPGADLEYGERAGIQDLPIAAEGTSPGGARRDMAGDREVAGFRGRDEIYPPAGVEETGYAGGDRGREDRGDVGPGIRMGDTETGEFRGHASEQEGVRQPGSDLEDRDELRVQRSEEELRAGTREREAGSVRVSKRVRMDRERMRVPKRREEVKVERMPVEGRETPEAEIGGGEVRMPVVEEEVVVEKRPVVQEELRIRKDVVREEEAVEEDVRKEEVDVVDETTRRRGSGGGSTERRDR